jgi:hypothetical protein
LVIDGVADPDSVFLAAGCSSTATATDAKRAGMNDRRSVDAATADRIEDPAEIGGAGEVGRVDLVRGETLLDRQPAGAGTKEPRRVGRREDLPASSAALPAVLGIAVTTRPVGESFA